MIGIRLRRVLLHLSLGPRKKIIIQPCLSFCSASALRQVLHIPISATCRALNLSKNPAQFLDNYYFPRPLFPADTVTFSNSDRRRG